MLGCPRLGQPHGIEAVPFNRDRPDRMPTRISVGHGAGYSRSRCEHRAIW
jgi:hypothetical protein